MSYGSYTGYTSSVYLPTSSRYSSHGDALGSHGSIGSLSNYGNARQLSHSHGGSYSTSPRSHGSQYLLTGSSVDSGISQYGPSSTPYGLGASQYSTSTHQYLPGTVTSLSPYTGSKSNTSLCSDSSTGVYDRALGGSSAYGSSPGGSLLSVCTPGFGSSYSSRSSSTSSLHSLGHSLHHDGSRYGSSRYSDPVGSTAYTTASSTGRDRPQSYSGTAYSRSYTSASIDSEKGGIDYKKLYEKEKLENEKLKKDMEKLKQEVSDLNYDLEKAKSKHESRTSDSREKRALERKISEYEEELKAMKNLEADNVRLKEENGALIRVISKLSK